ncbi:MAG: phosphate regulon sensor histidine kinase PhoR [Polaromonas sp.]|jgi:two-component system phosphate regulon sensor histidine kinase PhoR
MINRWFLFLVFLMVGSGVGHWAASTDGLIVGGLIAALWWLTLDSLSASRFLTWLRHELPNESNSTATDAIPSLPGMWGLATDRVRRLLVKRDRMLQERQLRLDEFLAAMQASPSGVVLLDAQDRIEWCNQMATQHFGLDARRDVLQHVTNLVRAPAFKAYMASNDFSHDVAIAGSGHTPGRPVNLSVHAHAYGADRKLLLSRDITAVELAEAMRRDFVANVSHEIRTPLTVLSGFIETLQTLPLKQLERERYLALMAQQSQRMQTLVNDLLTLSRLEGSPQPGANDWVNTHSLMAQCEQEARAMSVLLAPNGHNIIFDAGPASDIAGAQSELYSAMSNLVTNAVRYTPVAGVINVSWTVLDDGRGRFSVKDSGSGIAPEHLPRLTERFYRVDRSRSRETGGTGLGLAIVKHVSQRHGAELQIESVLGQGSLFAMVFPAARVRSIQAL